MFLILKDEIEAVGRFVGAGLRKRWREGARIKSLGTRSRSTCMRAFGGCILYASSHANSGAQAAAHAPSPNT